MNDNTNVYAKFKEKQIKLAKMIKDGSDYIAPLNMKQHSDMLNTLSNKVNSQTFKIQVIGTFKNGKSTFINSFLGSEILPAYATPCTAVINEVKHGKDKKAILYFKDPVPENLPTGIPEATLNHMRKYRNKNIPPIEIPYDEIEDYAVIPMGKDPKESLLESPYEKIELFWPLEILENGVEIIDSPGLNEHETRTRVAMEYLRNADAVIFVFTALALCSNDEMKFLENNIREQGFEDLYFVVNRYDMLNSDREKERVKAYALQKLKDQTTFGEKGIFFTSAYEALKGKMENNQQRFDGSGMPAFEASLSDFLVNHRGNIKLSQPARELKRIINEEALYKIIPQQMTMLSSSLDEIKSRYEEAKPRLDAMVNKKRQMADRISLLIERMTPDISRCINNYFTDLSNKIPAWVNEYEPTTSISLMHIKQGASDMVTEISEVVKENIADDQRIWMNGTLEPLVSDKVKDLMAAVEQNLENFYIEIDQIRLDISGNDAADNLNNVPMWQRVLAAGGGLLIGDIGVAAMGGMAGFSKDFVKGIALQIGAYLGLAVIGLLNPITIIGVIIGSLLFRAFDQKKQVVEKVKEALIQNVTEQVNKSAYDSTDKILAEIKGKISEFGNTIVQSMDTEINEIKIQVEDIIKQMESGKEKVEQRRKELHACEEKLKDLNMALDNFIFDLVQ